MGLDLTAFGRSVADRLEVGDQRLRSVRPTVRLHHSTQQLEPGESLLGVPVQQSAGTRENIIIGQSQH